MHPLRLAQAFIGRGGGLQPAAFSAPLLTSALLERGYGAPTFSRTTPKSITDCDGAVRNILSGEVGFTGTRRIRNLCANSENLTLAPWGSVSGGTGSAATCTAGFTAPDGTASAFRIQANRGAGTTTADQSGWNDGGFTSVAGQFIRQAVWIKSNTGSNQNVAIRLTGVNAAAVVTVTPQWQRLAEPAPNLASGGGYSAAFIGTRGTFGDQVLDVLVWRPQVEDVTTNVNQNPSEYVPVGAAKRNSYVQTENFAVSWAVAALTIASANNPAYDGNPVAAKLAETATSANHATFQVISKPAVAQTWGVMVDFKAAERNFGIIRIDDAVANGTSAFFDLQNGVIGTTTNIGTGFTVVAQTIRSLGNGYYRCFFSVITNTAATINCQVGPGSTNGAATYLGTLGSGVFVAYPVAMLGAVSEPAYFPVANAYSYPVAMLDGSTSTAFVDGVAYAGYRNGNTVTSNVVTQASGAVIGLTKNQSAYLPGVVGSDFTTPDSAASSVTGDIDVRAYVALPSWTPSSNVMFISKLITSGQYSYDFWIDASGLLHLRTTSDGTTIKNTISSVATGFAAGTAHWVRGTRVAATGTTTFYTSDDGQTWSQLGTTLSTTAGGIFDGTDVVRVGTNAANPLTGTVYRTQVYNGINGTLAVDFNPQDYASGNTWVSSTGETWTKNGGATILNFPLKGYDVWPTSKNVVLQSENFGTTWVASGTPTRVAAALRCGDVVLDLIGDDDATAAEGYTQNLTFTGDAIKALSIFFAQATSTSSRFDLNDVTAGNVLRAQAVITWSGGAPTVTMGTGTLLGVDALSGGVYRARVQTTAVTAANTNTLRAYPATDAAGAVAATGTAYFGGVQAEDATFCGPYTPTTTATVTRNTDVLNYPAAANASPVGLTHYCEASPTNTTGGVLVCINDGTISNRYLNSLGSGTGRCAITVTAGGVTQAAPQSTANRTEGTIGKYAGAAMQDYVQAYLNGTTGTLDTAATMPASFALIEVGQQLSGGSCCGGNVRLLKIWSAVLPDASVTRTTT